MLYNQHLTIGMITSIIFFLIMKLFFDWFLLDDIKLIFILPLIVYISPSIPDLDHHSGKLKSNILSISYIVGIVGIILFLLNVVNTNIMMIIGILSGALIYFTARFSTHRGFIHSIPFIFIIGLIVWYFTEDYQIGVLMFVGSYSHLVADKIPFKFR